MNGSGFTAEHVRLALDADAPERVAYAETIANGAGAGAIYRALRGDGEKAFALKATDVGGGGTRTYSFKAEKVQDEDGVIIGRVSVAGIFDRENERVLESALKSATWKLAANLKGAAVDINHDTNAIKCDVLSAHYDYDKKACVVALRPHDKQIFQDAKDGKISGMSWAGPYKLRAAA